jgi:cytidine deaminase
MTVDHELIGAARSALLTGMRWHEYTVAAAARGGDGRIFTGMNVFHFTGGPCAELVVLGVAAAHGVHRVATVVAVSAEGVVPPCGRCRQVLLDLCPDARIIVGRDEPQTVPVARLVPAAYTLAEFMLDGVPAAAGEASAVPAVPVRRP